MISLRLILVACLLTVAITGCDQPQYQRRHVKRHTKEHVENYRVRDANNDWIYWYILFNNNNNTYYYYSSPTPVSSYSSISWATSSSRPVQLSQENLTQIEELPTQEVEIQDLGETIAAEFDYGVPENNSLDSMEGVPDSAPDSSMDSSSDSFDSGSSDSGSFDSGGGDGI